ncbi:hypothetical protein [Microbulbifer pacificus]|uniref:DUF3805 domain-containing protein n=1 Tax=Microbulbifer pacificus TaxID=407164 RepID=A0AAU0MWI0_9GAMM|nr:hypothetical protein [Microbulbifer pacificus]WOX05062.1 hypothetical protein R5R33_15135 [Microbulbifer pacificus]
MRKIAFLISLLILSFGVVAKDVAVQPEGSGWKITKPKEWKLQADDDLWSFYRENGAGALQISIYKFKSTISEQQFLSIAEENNLSGAPLDVIQVQSFPALTAKYVDSGVYWKVWYIAIDNEFLFITYNCEVKNKALEEKAINAMVQSIRKA